MSGHKPFNQLRRKKYSAPYQYEEHVASVLPRARTTMASGALHGDYDVVSEATEEAPGFRIDCKLTDADSFRVSYKDFEGIREKCEAGQIPAFAVNIQGKESYFVIREQDLMGFVEACE